MAAGVGQRLQPVTLTTPKPLVRVNGVRMIDTQIAALHANGIHEIYVVVGYLKEQFREWAKQYDDVVLIENPWFDKCNNISSLYVARAYLDNVIIMDGDQMIMDPKILHPTFDRSGYSCIWNDHETKEWLMKVEGDVVTGCSRTGGSCGWQLFSVSRWNTEDGKRLRGHLEQEFETNNNRQIYWDDVAMFCYPDQYQLGIYPVSPGDLIEIDNMEELIQIDPTYCSMEKYI